MKPSRARHGRERLRAWYADRYDVYPWRVPTSGPYGVLVSEVMLQQTQAARVGPAYGAFLRRFPTVADLANASKADVVREWGRLGYPRRAVALHAAARVCVAEHGGRIPSEVEALLALPGVGPYTASAVASIGFGRPVAAIDTNVRRVVARFIRGVEPADLSADHLRADAESWLDRDDPAAWNQAVMDLGREVCRPLPRCDVCPVAIDCRFRLIGAAPRRPDRLRPRYEGSFRQVRGMVLDQLRRYSSVSESSLRAVIRRDRRVASAAIDSLVRDGIAERTEGPRVRLAR